MTFWYSVEWERKAYACARAFRIAWNLQPVLVVLRFVTRYSRGCVLWMWFVICFMVREKTENCCLGLFHMPPCHSRTLFKGTLSCCPIPGAAAGVQFVCPHNSISHIIWEFFSVSEGKYSLIFSSPFYLLCYNHHDDYNHLLPFLTVQKILLFCLLTFTLYVKKKK